VRARNIATSWALVQDAGSIKVARARIALLTKPAAAKPAKAGPLDVLDDLLAGLPGGDTHGVVEGDFREKGSLVADGSVDLIFTDPPYEKGCEGLYRDVTEFGAGVLAPGELCLACTGKLYLPGHLEAMQEHLEYVWLFATLPDGGCGLVRHLRFRDRWNLLACFGKPPVAPWWDWPGDLVSGRRDKSWFGWQKPVEAALHFIKHLTRPGGLVVDPFAGSGTTGVAAVTLGRRFVGVESDPVRARRARARVQKALKDAAAGAG
jgi:16S rRNA G966 N2-methylase RsmD